MKFLYQRTLQGLSMLLRLFVVHIQNHRCHGKSICKPLCHDIYGRKEIQIAPSDKTTNDKLDFSNKIGYPVSGKSNVN